MMSPSIVPNGAHESNGYGGNQVNHLDLLSQMDGAGSTTSGVRSDEPKNPNAGIPRQKRLACLICRRRKLKCDGRRPSCSTCSRLGHPCAYDEVRKKSGPKRGYVKALEERLKQVEVMLETRDSVSGTASSAIEGTLSFAVSDTTSAGAMVTAVSAGGNATATHPNERAAAHTDFNISDPSIGVASARDMDRWQFNGDSPPRPGSLDDFNFSSRVPVNMASVDSNFTWEIINLGLEEPLPPQETIDELHQIYFDKIHPSLPMIHRARYFAAMNLAPNQRPPVCLRYAMWTLACSVLDKFTDLKDLFYQRARKYLEADCMKGYGEHMISVAHCQTHIVLASYEFKMMYFPRAWMSTGQAVRLAQMIGLHRLDGSGLDVKQCLPPSGDWTEKEERRRTFWMAFCEDRYASIGTGWPMTVDERDITTSLPSSEEAFELNRPEPSVSLQDAMCPAGVGQLTPFAGIILMASLFGRNLIHLHRPDADDQDGDLNGEFWKRHRNLDNILLNTLLGLPPQLKLPLGLQNPNIVFTNMCIHTSTICLHQAAIFKADKNGFSSSVSAESKVRCITAANEIASIMRMVSHIDLSSMNPFISFCLYVAARVFVQFLKNRPEDSQTADSLRFLLTAMSALKRKNPLTESFLVQLDVDLEALGDRVPSLKMSFPTTSESPPTGSLAVRQGATCEEGPADGILSYQKEISKPRETTTGSSTTGETSEDMSHKDRQSSSLSASTSTSANGSSDDRSSGQPGRSWLGSESRLPTRERNPGHAAMFPIHQSAYPDPTANTMMSSNGRPIQGFGRGDVADIQDLSASSADSMSNRPTPNSTTSSDQRQILVPPQGGQLHSGGSSFNASPVSPPRGLVSGGPSGTGVNRHTSGYYTTGGSSDYPPPPPNASAAANLTSNGGLGGILSAGPQSSGYTLQEGWGLPGQTAMTPVSEGVLRSIMQMGPMETMDLGWDTNP